jgi:hypothetical protein
MFQAADNLHARLTHELSRHVDPLCAAVLQPMLSYWIMCQCADDPHAVLCRAFAADMFQAADNLHARLTHELSRHVDLLELVEAAQAVGHLMFNMTPAQRRSLGHLQKVWGDRISGAGGGVRSGQGVVNWLQSACKAVGHLMFSMTQLQWWALEHLQK